MAQEQSNDTTKDLTKGQIISGEFGEILVRQKNDAPIEVGELLIAQHPYNGESILLQAYDVAYGSQIAQQQRELISGMYLEEKQEVSFFEPHLRNYTLAKLKALLHLKGTDAVSAKTLPPFFSTVRGVTATDMSFLQKPAQSFAVGKLRSGSKELDVEIALDTKAVLSHHVLIAATTGKGKSNLMSVMLFALLDSPVASLLVFDPHDEYFGRNGQGLKDHPLWKTNGSYYTQSNPPAGALQLLVHMSLLKPRHFSGVVDFSGPQTELMHIYYNKYGDRWIEALLKKEPVDFNFMDGTYDVVLRRLCRLLDIELVGAQNGQSNQIVTHGIYSFTAGKTTLIDIIDAMTKAKTVVVDTSTLSGQNELLLSSIITSAVYDAYKRYRQLGQLTNKPVVSIVLEEAPRVLGKEVLERGQNIFGTIAKEGRKFNVGLCAITQLPSLIPKDILANMNTKIILGIEMAVERSAIIESAAQDLSDDSRAIASLDKGEAIITSNFTRFAIPLKIPLFSSVVTQTKIKHGTTVHKLQGL